MAQRAPSRDHKLRESIRTAAFLSRLLVAAIARRWDEFCGGWPTALFGISFMELSQSTGSPRLLYPTGRPSQSGGTLPITWTRAANQCFDVRKILATGTALVGMGLFEILSKPNLEWIIGSYGLCAGYVGLGILPLVISLPTAYFLFRDAAPDGVDKDGCFTRQANGLTMKETLGQWRFWLLAIGLILILFSLSVSVPNLGKRSSSWMPCLRARSCR